MINPNPECTNDCRFAVLNETTTLTGFTPTYNKEGAYTNADPNITTSTVKCYQCGRSWVVETNSGVISSKQEVLFG